MRNCPASYVDGCVRWSGSEPPEAFQKPCQLPLGHPGNCGPRNFRLAKAGPIRTSSPELTEAVRAALAEKLNPDTWYYTYVKGLGERDPFMSTDDLAATFSPVEVVKNEDPAEGFIPASWVAGVDLADGRDSQNAVLARKVGEGLKLEEQWVGEILGVHRQGVISLAGAERVYASLKKWADECGGAWLPFSVNRFLLAAEDAGVEFLKPWMEAPKSNAKRVQEAYAALDEQDRFAGQPDLPKPEPLPDTIPTTFGGQTYDLPRGEDRYERARRRSEERREADLQAGREYGTVGRSLWDRREHAAGKVHLGGLDERIAAARKELGRT